jgi:hypothetical protein
MLLLTSFLLQKDKAWSKCRLRLFCIAEGDDSSIQMERDMVAFLALLRITADVRVIEMEGSVEHEAPNVRRMKASEKLNRLLRRYSGDAALVMLSLPAEPQDDAIPTSPTRPLPPFDGDDDGGDGGGGGEGGAVVPLQGVGGGSAGGGGGGGAGSNPKRADYVHRYPGLGGEPEDEASLGSTAYLQLLEPLTEGLDRLVLIGGGGSEVVTIFN